MSNKTFTQKEIEVLRTSPYVQNVSQSMVFFSASFKEQFWKMLCEGKAPRDIVIALGIDPDILGDNRIAGLKAIVKREVKAGKGFRDYITYTGGYTKEILSWVLSDSLVLDFVLDTVTQLCYTHDISLTEETIIHSDQGAHYTSIKFIELVKDKNLRQSMSRKANCWDNAPQESFFGHMKDEIDISQCTTFEEVCKVVSDWTDYYNNDRYQWDLAKLSPREFYLYCITGVYPLTIPKPKGKQQDR